MKIRIAQNLFSSCIRYSAVLALALAIPVASNADFAKKAWHKLATHRLPICEAQTPPACDVELVIDAFDASCAGANDGILDMTILVGEAPFTIDWDNDGTGDNDDLQDLQDLPVGTYSVTVTDNNGCLGFASFDIFEPSAIDISGAVTDLSTPNAGDGAIDLNIVGGTLPYSYDWSYNGPSSGDPEDPNSLGAGTYSVTVTDANSCTNSASFTIEAPACGLDLNVAIASSNCFGSNDGKINLSVFGGQAPYLYDWSNDGTGDNDDDQDLHNLTPGSYSVTATDAGGCTGQATYQVTEPSDIFLSANVGNASAIGANDGWIDLTATGSTPPYTYDWSNDGTGDNNDPQDLAALTAGTYTVTVTDAHNCSKTASYTITQPQAFDLALRKTLANGQPGTVAPGSTVTFTITVFNQGGIGATNVLVIDYLPTNLNFTAGNNPGWVNFGSGPTWFISSLPAGASVSRNIRLTVSANSPLTTLNNYAEITAADDNDPNTFDLPIDVDSKPNAFLFDDPGGQPNGPADNIITGNGTGLPGSSNPLTDEDDHDGAAIIVSIPSVTLGNLVFEDKNNDGLFNNNDAGIEGVEVKLYKAGPDFAANTSDDQFVATTTTNAQGEYFFMGLLDGYYFVKLSGTGIPVGFVSSTGDGVFDMDGAGAYEPAAGANLDVDGKDDGTQLGAEITSDVMLLSLGEEPTGGDVNNTLDFGLYLPLNLSSLGDFVWYDNDLDGQQDLGEPGVQGVKIRLFDLGTNGAIGGGDDNQIDFETTNSDGFYSFTNIVPNNYYLQLDLQTLPSNYLPTSQNQGNDATDSDFNAQGLSPVVTLLPGDANNSLDFGLKPLLSGIGNFVWNDLDHDGLQDFSESGVAGVIVKLYNLGNDGQQGGGDDALVLADTTNADGFYGFENLVPGNYYLQLDMAALPPGFLASPQNQGNDLIDSDATADGKTATFTLSPGQTNTSLDFGIYKAIYDLSLTKSLSPGQTDTVDINDLVSYDITVTNQGNTAVQDIIVVDHIPAGLVFVQNNPGWTLHAADSASYFIAGPVQAGQSVTVPIRLLVQYGASGQTMVNRAEIIGVEDAFGNAVLDLDSTPDNGNPNEDDLSATAIELIPHDPTGWVYCDKTGRIITGGTISVTGPNGIPNSQVNIIHDGSSGYYEFYTNGTPGIYTISYNHPNGYPISGDCAPQPGPIDITGMPDPYVLGLDTVSAGQLSSVNCASNPYYLSFDIEAGDPVVYFNNLPLACTYIGSVVSEDANFNDQFDAADLPLPGVTVNLYDCADPTTPIANTTTDGAGRYRFDGLQPGNYQVGFAPVAGFRFVSTGNIDPSGLSNCTTLAWGECDTTLAITLYECPTVNAGPDRAHCFAADTSHLDAGLSHGTGNFTWTPVAGLTNANIVNPIASPSANTSYIINFNDGFGCTDSDTIAVTVGSSTPFLVNSPFTDSTVACAPLPFELPVFGDVCDPNLIITSNTVITPITCGFIRRTTWTARNAIGNTASFTQTVTVDDNEAPTMNASHPFFGAILHGDTLYADCSQIPSLDSLGFGSFDNCSVPTVNFTENITNGSCPTDGFFQSRYCGWTSTDACGNVDSLYFTVIITDNLPPVLSPAPPDITVNCNAVPPAATLTATDNCTTGLTVTVADVSVADGSGCVTTIVRTWTVEDACGNMASASQTITVDDDTSPTLIGVPANAMLDCSVPVPPAPVVTATDACDNDVPVVPSQSTTGDPSTGCYSIVRTWRATDNCGNNVQRSQTLVFSDTTPPVLNGVPADQSYDCSTVVPSAAAVTATDNCDSSVPVVFSETINGNHTTGCFSISRTWRATDDCGNVATATQVVTVTDNTAPLLSGVPADLTLDCASPVPAPPAVTASDLCDGNIPVVFTENTNLTTACRVITRRWTATDDCGNTAIATQTITLRDTQAPVLSATPANASYTCLSEVPPVPTITATDNCDTNAPVLFFTSTIGNPAGCSFQIRRTWAVADDCNNATVWVQTITVNDNVPPSFATAIPANVSINCGTPLPAVPTITATDNCDANVQVTMTTAYLGDPTASCYILTRTWTATDDCGNSVSASQDIQVRDTEAPNFVGLPNNGTVDCDNLPGDNVTATDNCDNNVTVTISDNVQSSVLGCATQVVRTWTATDDCGNTRIASRTFNVQNTDAPAITIVEPALLGVQDGDVLYLECDALPSLTNTSAVATSDCCGAAAVVFHESATGADCATAGYYAVMQCGWVATDCCGNADSLFFTVYVIDNTPPEFFGVPANVELPLGSPLPPLASVFTVDNCDNSTPISYNQTTTGPADNQLTTRTWSATDNCGNTGIAVQTILIVDDNQAPLIANVPADMTIEGPIGSLPGGVDDVTVTDNRDDNPTVEYSEERTGGQCCYLLTRRWVAFDDFGNTSIAEQKITVTDTQAPVISGAVADVSATCQLGLVPLPQLSASDNCTGNLALQFTADTLQMSCGYQIVRTWTATDECGNAATRTQTLTVEDVEGPSFATADEPSAIFYASQNALPNAGANIAEGQTIAAGETWSIGNQAMPSLAGIAADNCTAQAGLSFRVENIEVENLGCEQRWTVSFAVLDACGNASAANLKATATFVDDTAPVFGSQPQNLTVDCGNLPTPMTLAATDAFGSAVSIQFAEAQNNNASGGCLGEIVRTWTATDACGNSAIAEQKINVVDNAAPVMANVPTSTLAACGNVPPAPANISATDNCTGVVPVVFSETING
ncbi:MAG: hypothetical protein MUC59_00370, partial [Saprospiraceae bacterium]|nr:hypothetical protein [Saprospiraceae bacterium]